MNMAASWDVKHALFCSIIESIKVHPAKLASGFYNHICQTESRFVYCYGEIGDR